MFDEYDDHELNQECKEIDHQIDEVLGEASWRYINSEESRERAFALEVDDLLRQIIRMNNAREKLHLEQIGAYANALADTESELDAAREKLKDVELFIEDYERLTELKRILNVRY